MVAATCPQPLFLDGRRERNRLAEIGLDSTANARERAEDVGLVAAVPEGPIDVRLLDEQNGAATTPTVAAPGARCLDGPTLLLTPWLDDLHGVFLP
jgi:hypothetical protein